MKANNTEVHKIKSSESHSLEEITSVGGLDIYRKGLEVAFRKYLQY